MSARRETTVESSECSLYVIPGVEDAKWRGNLTIIEHTRTETWNISNWLKGLFLSLIGFRPPVRDCRGNTVVFWHRGNPQNISHSDLPPCSTLWCGDFSSTGNQISHGGRTCWSVSPCGAATATSSRWTSGIVTCRRSLMRCSAIVAVWKSFCSMPTNSKNYPRYACLTYHDCPLCCGVILLT